MATPVADEWVTLEDEWVDEPDAPTAPVDPKAARIDAAKRFALGRNFDRTPAPVGDILTKQMPMALAQAAALQYGPGLLSKIPVGRMVARTGQALEKAGDATRPVTPMALGGALLTGDLGTLAVAAGPSVMRAGGRALQRMAAPKVPAAVSAAAGPKPKLSASQVKQALREQYGSEKGGRMLYGPARPGVTAAARQELMKQGTTGGTLPKAAQRAIEQELAASTADEAFAYAAKAPNAPAQSHVGEMLKKALEARRTGR